MRKRRRQSACQSRLRLKLTCRSSSRQGRLNAPMASAFAWSATWTARRPQETGSASGVTGPQSVRIVWLDQLKGEKHVFRIETRPNWSAPRNVGISRNIDAPGRHDPACGRAQCSVATAAVWATRSAHGSTRSHTFASASASCASTPRSRAHLPSTRCCRLRSRPRIAS